MREVITRLVVIEKKGEFTLGNFLTYDAVEVLVGFHLLIMPLPCAAVKLILPFGGSYRDLFIKFRLLNLNLGGQRFHVLG